MIRFTLQMTPQSTISVEDLRSMGLSGVIAELDACGYTVETTISSAPEGHHRSRVRYPVRPGPATLSVDTDRDRVQFTLTGPTFGKQAYSDDIDPVVWMRLVVLGVRFREAYFIETHVTDPELGQQDRAAAGIPTPEA